MDRTATWVFPAAVKAESVPDDSRSYPRRVFSSGPLAVDPKRQRFVGVLMENDTHHPELFVVKLFDKDHCPKRLKTKFGLLVYPQCTIGIAFDVPGGFYEAQIATSPKWGLLTAVYALTEHFEPIAANTLHPADLIMVHG